MRIHYLQHVPYEGPARIEEWAAKADHTVTGTRLYLHEPLPRVDDVDFLIIMGGPMGVNDEARLRWMKGEKRFIGRAIQKGKKVLGVCLGAQLIASVMGSRVSANRHKEIGWFPIELDMSHVRLHPLNVLPPRITVFHWHGDTFDLPDGALHLARSQACENQAFAVGNNIVGLQFHLEMGLPQIETMLRQAAADLTPGEFVMDPEEILDLAPSQVPPLNAALSRFLDSFTAS